MEEFAKKEHQVLKIKKLLITTFLDKYLFEQFNDVVLQNQAKTIVSFTLKICFVILKNICEMISLERFSTIN